MTLLLAAVCAGLIVLVGSRARWAAPTVLPLVVGLWLAFAAGVAVTFGSGIPLEKAFNLGTVTLLCAVMPCLVYGGLQAQRWLLGISLALAFVMAVATTLFPDRMAQEIFGRLNLDGQTAIGTARVLGASVVIAALIALGGGKYRWIWWAAAAVGTAFTLAVGSRGPMISVLFSVAFAVVLARRFKGRRVSASAQLIGGFLALGAFVTVSPTAASDRIRLFLLGDQEDVAREYLFDVALREIPKSPFGVGWGGFQVPRSFWGVDGGTSVYPHNIFLEIAVEGGWLAAIAFVVFAFYALVGFIRNSVSLESAALLGLGIYWFSVAQTSSDVNGNRMTWVMLVVGLISWKSSDRISGFPIESSGSKKQASWGRVERSQVEPRNR
ncbi:O-antigen ligase family protein [Jidongwangia harbinensis]|uniref:O-antigen ligase family protein n=1 Tax=Jidongwangia harbinensis TaxID=2878561 RepID=UPI001CD954CA|nr:O-antigen ligase family protein [Jidongwangia harbinensis]MCA2213272.1 O-antigen ligase family protein [Jidongwangia harbinensis]